MFDEVVARAWCSLRVLCSRWQQQVRIEQGGERFSKHTKVGEIVLEDLDALEGGSVELSAERRGAAMYAACGAAMNSSTGSVRSLVQLSVAVIVRGGC